MENYEEKAIKLFKSDFNCAQSVLTSFAEEYKFDKNLALSISTGFGGGMGRLQWTCGAVTGAFMFFGIYNASKYPDNSDRKDKTYTMVQKFNKRFRDIYGTTDCKELLNCDIRSIEGQKFANDNNLFETVCENCIRNSIRIINGIIK